jgi:predicted RNA-binding protein with PUA-like domain
MKSEPASYGWESLVRDGRTEWDGIRNPAARLHLRAMKKGDRAFFYHSGTDKAVVGIMAVAREAAPDPKDANWVSVAVEPVAPLARPVTLAAIKADPRLGKLEMLRQSRLSVSPVREEEWAVFWNLRTGPAEAAISGSRRGNGDLSRRLIRSKENQHAGRTGTRRRQGAHRRRGDPPAARRRGRDHALGDGGRRQHRRSGHRRPHFG